MGGACDRTSSPGGSTAGGGRYIADGSDEDDNVSNEINSDSDEQKGQAALDLICKHKDKIIEVSRGHGVDLQHVASIIFQEKYYGIGASFKNAPAWVMIYGGANDASVGLAEMDINTAARLLGVDVATMSKTQRKQIIELLKNDQSAISLIALNVASFETALDRPVIVFRRRFFGICGVG